MNFSCESCDFHALLHAFVGLQGVQPVTSGLQGMPCMPMITSAAADSCLCWHAWPANFVHALLPKGVGSCEQAATDQWPSYVGKQPGPTYQTK